MYKRKIKHRMDVKKILDRVRKRNPPRKNHSFYLSIELVETFHRVCAKLKVPAAATIEEMMEDFINEQDSERTKK